MKKIIGSNWKTTLLGLCAGIPLIINGIASKDLMMIVSGISIILGGRMSRDYDNTDIR